jgi:uridine kinase
MNLADLAAPIVERIGLPVAQRSETVFVGLDGRSGSGKSTLAQVVADVFVGRGESVTVIEGDQFYGGGSGATWDARTTSEKVDRVIDWRRQRDVLEKLHQPGHAEWAQFDWHADDWDSAEVPLSDETLSASAGAVVILEGAYSCRPQLRDLLNLAVLLDVPEETRRCQLLGREGDVYRSEWEGRWSSAEDHYFGFVVPPDSFDLVVGRG